MKTKAKKPLLQAHSSRRKVRRSLLLSLLEIPLRKAARKYKFRGREKAFRKQPMAGGPRTLHR